MNATIRLSTSEDDSALVSLSARSPMQAPLSICIERSPSFFALRDLRGPSRTLVAEREGAVVGCVSVTTRRVLFGGEPRDVDYVADLKVPPAERRRGIARALVQAVLRDAPPRLHVWTNAVGNDALSGVLESSGLASAPLARFKAFQLLPIFVGRRPPVGVDRARPSDEDELRALLYATMRCRNLAPALGANELGGVPLDAHIVVRRAGRIVAALATWEGSSVKQTRVVRMTRALRLFQRASTLLPQRTGARALPPEGSLLRFHSVRNAACRADAVDALSVLCRAALHAARARGDHFLLFGCDERDPFTGALARIPRLTYRYELRGWHPHRSAADTQTAVTPQPVYFDDPALS